MKRKGFKMKFNWESELSREVFVAEDGTLMFADLTHDEMSDYFIVGVRFSDDEHVNDYILEDNFDWILREPQWL